MAAAKDSSSSGRIDQIEERLLDHKWLSSIACAVIAVLVLLPVYAELVSEPADANAGTGCWVVPQYSVNAARPGGGVYRERDWRLTSAILPPCCQKLSNQTTLFIPYDDSGGHNRTIHHLSFCEEDDTCASCEGDAFAVEAATCAAGRCESRRKHSLIRIESPHRTYNIHTFLSYDSKHNPHVLVYHTIEQNHPLFLCPCYQHQTYQKEAFYLCNFYFSYY